MAFEMPKRVIPSGEDSFHSGHRRITLEEVQYNANGNAGAAPPPKTIEYTPGYYKSGACRPVVDMQPRPARSVYSKLEEAIMSGRQQDSSKYRRYETVKKEAERASDIALVTELPEMSVVEDLTPIVPQTNQAEAGAQTKRANKKDETQRKK